jgi:alginate O-acetyltransferase complex protein AlgI
LIRRYRADSITDFWRRWNISLSTWLREYLYIPLGGNRCGTVRTYFNLIITMLLGGLWRGASWNFVIWGGIDGGMLAFERSQGCESFYRRLPKFLRTGMTFLIVLLGWVFFRASDLPDAIGYLTSMLGTAHTLPGAALVSGIVYKPYYLLCFAIAAVVLDTGYDGPQGDHILWPWLGLALAVLAAQQSNPFIYFIF